MHFKKSGLFLFYQMKILYSHWPIFSSNHSPLIFLFSLFLGGGERLLLGGLQRHLLLHGRVLRLGDVRPARVLPLDGGWRRGAVVLRVVLVPVPDVHVLELPVCGGRYKYSGIFTRKFELFRKACSK